MSPKFKKYDVVFYGSKLVTIVSDPLLLGNSYVYDIMREYKYVQHSVAEDDLVDTTVYT